MRMPRPPDEMEQAQPERDPDAPQHADDRDPGERSGATRTPSAATGTAGARPDVEQAEYGHDHDRGEAAQRHVMDEPGAGDHTPPSMGAPERPANWLRAPVSSTTAVRDPRRTRGTPEHAGGC